MTSEPVAWVNGELMPLRQAGVSVLDQGFRTGEGVFETMRAYGGHVFRLAAHLHRAVNGAERLGFEAPTRAELADAVTATVLANEGLGPDLAARLTITPGILDPADTWPPSPIGAPTVVVTVHRLALDQEAYTQGISAVTLPWSRSLADIKAVSHMVAMLARRRAAEQGAHEALLTNPDGQVVEGASSNIFAVFGDKVVTPPLSPELLPGVTRATVLEVAPHAGVEMLEDDLTAELLLEATEAFITSSTRELVPVVELDGRQIGSGRPGPVTLRLLAAYGNEVRAEAAGTGATSSDR